jgi:acyl-CoA thioester hydrolase
MYTEQFKVRFCETDALTHVNNTVVAAWFETAREPIFRIFTPDLNLTNWPLILASYKIDFLQQISYGQPVEVKTFISRLGNSSFDTYQEVWQSGEKRASGTTTLVNFDYPSSKAVPIEGNIRTQLENHLQGE